MNSRWFVCHTKVHEEDRARFFLEEKGFDVYLPMMETQRVIGQRSYLCSTPLFPQYLFVRFNHATDLCAVRWTKGIHKILPESVRPVPVDDQIVESFRSLAQKDGIIRKQPFSKSDNVRILRGPLKEMMGIFEEWSSDRGRIRILLNLIHYQATVELHHSLVQKVV